MKKIVALVLSLVMVLGLATTAFAATTSYSGLYAQDANDVADKSTNVTIVVTPAKAVKYDKTYGNPVENGNIEYVTVTTGTGDVAFAPYYKFVGSLAEADVVLYKDSEYKVAKFYLAEVVTPFYKEGVAFTNFGEDCGETTYVTDEDVTYYTVKGALDFGVYAEVETSTDYLMVAGKMVPVAFATNHKVAHAPVYEVKNGKVLAIECGACGLDAVKAPNALSVPKGITAFDGTWYWPTEAAAPAADATVESAQTFDAGIAMYVGMSVMAAAGSAVVLKKKD